MSSNKHLKVSLFSNIIAMIVSLGVSFFLTPFLIKSIGKEAYSFFPLANNFIAYMNILSIALNSMAARFITISMASGEKEKSKGYFSSVFYSNLFLSGILLLPMVVIIALLDFFLDIPSGLVGEIKLLFGLMFFSFIIQLLFSVFGVATFAKERMDLYALQNIGHNVLRAGLYFLLFRILPTSIVIMGIVTTVLIVFNGVMQFIFTRKLMPDYRISHKYYNVAYIKEILSSGVWNSVNNIGTSLLQTMMLLLANVLISATDSGDLSIVQTLPNLMTTIISTIFGVLLPRVANVYAAGNNENTIRTTINAQKILSLVSVIPVIIIVLMGKQFYVLWMPGENAEYLQIVSIITVAPLLIHSSMWMVYGLNVMNNKVKWPAITFLIAGVVNVIVTCLVVKLTAIGLVAIPLVSGIINILYYVFFIPSYAAKEMGVSWRTFYPHLIKTVLFSAGICLLGLPLYSNIVVGSWVGFVALGGTTAVILEIVYALIILDRSEKRMTVNAILKLCNRR